MLAPLALFAALAPAADGPADAVWLEGEAAVAAAPLAPGGLGRTDWLSGERWLTADLPVEAVPQLPAGGLTASWPFAAPAAGRYEVWARVGCAADRAAFRWRVAGRPWLDVPADAPPHDPVGLDDGTPVGWVRAGAIDLPAGAGTLEVNVPRPAAGPLRFALDAVCLSRGPFFPDGPHQPGTSGRQALDAEAVGRGFEFPPPVPGSPAHARRTLDLAGTWQAVRWDEPEVADRAAHVAALPPDLPARPWRGLRVPGELATVRPEWAYCHRFLLRTRFTLPGDAAGRSVVLRLPNAALLATVFVNGRAVGRSEAPHAPFDVDLTAAVRTGPNELVVAIKDRYYAAADAPWRQLRLLPPDQFAASDLTRQLDWPVRNARAGGLLEAPTLTVAGPAYTADVFVRPQVAAGRLAADVTVRNPGPTPRTVEVRPVVRPMELDGRIVGGPPAKAFAPVPLTVPAGGEATVRFDEPWPNARLWWPDDPVRYALETTVAVAGRPADELVTRFGYREWATSGTRVTLNGVPWKLTADRRSADPQPGPLATQAVKAWRAGGVSLFRFTGERPWTGQTQADTLAFCDAAGVPVWRAWADDPPATPEQAKNWQTLAVSRAKAERNSPAVALWAVPPGMDPAVVRAVDPTRPVVPAVTPTAALRDHPDAAYSLPSGPEATVQPLADEPPSFFAAVGGEAAFAGRREAAAGADLVARMRAEGDRWRGAAVTLLESDGGASHPNAWQPVAVLVREWDATVPSGQPLTRTLKLLNDTRVGTPITVHWLFRVRGTAAEVRGKRVVKLPPGGSEEFPLTLDLPPGDRLEADLVLTCEREGRELFRDVRRLHLVGPPPKLDAPPGAVIVWDPAGKLPGFADLPRVRDPFAPPAGCRVLVVGPDAVRSPAEARDPRWKALAAGGLRLVVLDQTHPLHYQAVPADLDPTPHGGRFAFPDDPTHPLFAGLAADDLRCWNNGHTVFRGAYTRPTRGGRSLVSCDDELGLTAVAEVPVGQGVLLLSQLAVRDHPADPVARRLVVNLVNYALGYERRSRPTAVLLPDDARRALLGGGGLRAGRPADPLDALAAGVAVLDGTAGNLQALVDAPDATAKFFAAGGWLVAWGVGPDAAGAFNALVGVDHLHRPAGNERVTRTAGDPLAASLSPRTLAAGDLFARVVDASDDVAAFARGRPPWADLWAKMTDGRTAVDGPRHAVHVPMPPGTPRPVWAAALPRREAVTGISVVVNADHRPISRARVLFDDDPATALTVTLRPVPGLRQEFAVNPPRDCTTVGFEPLQWAGPGAAVVGLDEVGVRVKRPADWAARVVPLAGGGLVKYPRGGGGVVLCQLRADAADPPDVAAGKRELVAGLLRGLGADCVPERVVLADARLRTDPVPLGDTAGPRTVSDGPDLSGLPTGTQLFNGVRFDLPSGPRAVLAGSARGLAVGRPADTLHFLHAFRQSAPVPAGDPFPEVLRYTVRYADGGSAVVPVRLGRGVRAAGAEPLPLADAEVGWATGATPTRTAVYQTQWTNPYPADAVASVDVDVPPGVGRWGVPVVLGVSAGVLR